MPSFKKKYTAESFKKEKKDNNYDSTSNDSSRFEILSDDSNSEFSSHDDEDTRSEYDDDTVSSSESELDEDFNNEDRLISRLYRKVVDEIMLINKLRECKINHAIDEMKLEISKGHRKGFRRFRGIDFNKPENCCGYLRRYAMCHTGLVKKVLWNFLKSKTDSIESKVARREILQQNRLKVVSLGGGPGNDLIGFCCALHEIVNVVEELDLYIIDICKGWKTVFPTILQKAVRGNFGSMTEYLKKIKINTGFMAADLTTQRIFKNKKLSLCLAEADIVFMVKLTSFLPDTEAGDLIQNVVDCMKPEAKLIFIDQPYDEDFFSKIKSLNFIHHDRVKYELSFNPAKYYSPSISSTQAHVGIFEKRNPSEEDSTEES